MPTPNVAPGDQVFATNVGDKTVKLQWDGRVYPLEPGKKRPVPFEAVMAGLGDPRSGPSVSSIRMENGETAFIPDRPSEVRRLRLYYGHHSGPEGEFDPRITPQIEVTDLDDNVITTVLNDPEGYQGQVPAVARYENTRELLDIVRQQQQQIERLMAMQNIKEGERAQTMDDIPTDEDEVDLTPSVDENGDLVDEGDEKDPGQNETTEDNTEG